MGNRRCDLLECANIIHFPVDRIMLWQTELCCGRQCICIVCGGREADVCLFV